MVIASAFLDVVMHDFDGLVIVMLLSMIIFSLKLFLRSRFSETPIAVDLLVLWKLLGFDIRALLYGLVHHEKRIQGFKSQ